MSSYNSLLYFPQSLRTFYDFKVKGLEKLLPTDTKKVKLREKVHEIRFQEILSCFRHLRHHVREGKTCVGIMIR